MKIRPLTPETTLKDNEYIIQSKTSGKLVIKIDSQFIHNLTFSFVSCVLQKDMEKENIDEVDKFLFDNIDLFYEAVEIEIQYVLNAMSLVFCTEKDYFKNIRQNFYKFNNKLELMIVYLIWRNVEEIMFMKYSNDNE